MFFKIRRACHTLKIIDRGERETERNPETQQITFKICGFCNTRLRIGIKKDDAQPIWYCWRCVQIATVSKNYISRDTTHDDKRKKRRDKFCT